MPATSPTEAAEPHVPAFAPVPVRARSDGWTEGRQRLFIAELARSGCVGRAALAAGMSRESAYRLRRRRGAESFAAAWDSILAARPRGSSSLALIWDRLVKKHGGRSAVRCVAAPPDEEWQGEIRCPGGGRPDGRSQ